MLVESMVGYSEQALGRTKETNDIDTRRKKNRVLWCEQQTKTSHGNQQAPDPRTGLMIKYVTS